MIHSQKANDCVFLGLQYGILPSDVFDPEHEVIAARDRMLFDTVTTKLYLIGDARKTPVTGDDVPGIQPGTHDQDDPDGYEEIPKPIKVPKGSSVEQHLAGIQASDPRRKNILEGE